MEASSTQALEDLEWNADSVIAGFGEELEAEGTVLIDYLLQRLRSESSAVKPALPSAILARSPHGNVQDRIIAEYRRTEDGWHISFGNEAAKFGPLKGLNYLEQLLRCNGAAVGVQFLDLEAVMQTQGTHKPDTTLDPKAWRASKREFERLLEELERATSSEDEIAIKVTKDELSALAETMNAERGWRGQGKKLDPAADGLRQRVGKGLAYALKVISERMPQCGQHLGESILDRTGWAPRYQSSGNVLWMFTRD